MKEIVLMAGGSGLIGANLKRLLENNNYEVRTLSRNLDDSENSSLFYWDPKFGELDIAALKDVSYIIQLSGANIVEKRWTQKRKQELIDSRIESTNLLYSKVVEHKIPLKAFIVSAAIGFYGSETNDHICVETDTVGKDFLASICQSWETASFKFKESNIRTVVFRTSIVLSPRGGALQKIITPIRFGFGAAFGSGKQILPWIHIEDICNLFLYAIKNEKISGIYNAAAPSVITNKEMITKCAAILKKPYWLPNIPGFLFSILLGELALVLLNGNIVSPKKILDTGFQFKYNNIDEALNHLIKPSGQIKSVS